MVNCRQQKAEQGEFDIAEDLLISHYDPKEIKRQIDRLRTIEAFEPRVDLAYNAWKDYSEERYHAVVPVVLSLIEGLVLQTCVEKLGHRKGFFYKTANFTAWDSIAAHEKGLERLADRDLLLQSRNSTTTETIDIPYRHGIVHGLDLGYDNKAVAAKSWAILFAVGEWARKAYKNELEKPEDTDNIDLSSPQKIKEVFQQIDEQRQRAERRQEWEPRKIEVGVDIPAEAEPDAYNEGTPEHVLMETLHAWKQEQWGLMPDAFVDVAGNQPHVEEISDQFENLDLKSVKLLDIYRFAPALCEITVKLGIKRDDEIEWEEKTITLEYRASEGRIGFPEMDEGHWAIKNRHVFY